MSATRDTSGRTWRILVPAVCLVAGVVFATSAHESRGTDLRAPGTANLVDTVQAAEARVHDADHDLRDLQARVDRAEKQAGRENSGVAAAQSKVTPLQTPAGLTTLRGPGLEVVLDDADPDDLPAGTQVDPNQLVVHQSDLQAVVNALWAGGAEAVSIAGQRIVATSAVRCVGNTLLLNGEVYSPPYRVLAIGPAGAMQDRLSSSPGVKLYREAAGYYGLGYTVEQRDEVNVGPYRGSLSLVYAHAGG
jgi:uncharacterized protein YlxW (UPF0749 family)